MFWERFTSRWLALVKEIIIIIKYNSKEIVVFQNIENFYLRWFRYVCYCTNLQLS